LAPNLDEEIMMAEKNATARGGNAAASNRAAQVGSSTPIPDSIQRAIEAHAREWLADQKQEAKLAQELTAESEKDSIRRADSLAPAHNLEAEMQKLALWRAERRRQSAGARPQNQEAES
jgi:hypothetical protein